MSPDLALVIVSVCAALYIGLLLSLRDRLTARLGPQGYVLLWGFSASYYVPAFCWLAGISAPFNDSSNPVLTGTGGNYGLNYQYYPQALTVYLLTPALTFLCVVILPVTGRNYQSALEVMKHVGTRLRIERVAYVAFIIAVILTVWYFYIIGWDRFWISRLDRFEAANDNEMSFSIKISLTFILAAGCLGAALMFFRGVMIISTLTVMIAALPFIAFASRGMSVLMAAYAVGLFFRVPAKSRWLIVLPLFICVYYSLRLPLIMRSSGQTGVWVAVENLFRPAEQGSDFKEAVASSLQNVGQGFGVMVEEREVYASGSSIVEGIPVAYFLLSVSPTLSLIDGFGDNWLMFHPRLNGFTPYSGLCELMAISPIIGVGFPILCFLIGVWVCRRESAQSLWYDAGLFAFVLLMILGFLQMQQYPLRTATRFFFAAGTLMIGFHLLVSLAQTSYAGQPLTQGLRFLAKTSAEKSTNPRQNQQAKRLQ